MKKIVIAVLLLTLFGCSSQKEVKEGVIGEKIVVENLLSYEIDRLEAVKRIEPSITAGFYSYQKPKDSANVLLDLVLRVKNESTDEIQVKDYISSVFELNDNEYKASVRVEKDGGTDISAYEGIDPMKSALVHIYIEIAEADITDEILCKLTIDKETSEMKLNRKTLTPVKNYKKSGETVKKNDTASITFKGSSVAKKLEPPKAEGFYTYYKVKDNDDSFAILKMKVKNIGETDLDIEEFIGCKAKVDEKYDYSGFVVWEADDATDLTNTRKLAPLKETNAYCLIQIPDEVIKKSTDFKINVLDDTYYVKK